MNREADSYIDPTALLGKAFRPLQGFVLSDWKAKEDGPHFAGKVHIGPYACVEEGALLGHRVVVDSYCSIGRGASIGDDTLVIYRASVGGDAVVGRECVIGGMVSEGSRVGDRSRVFGRIIHKHEDSTISWDHHPTPEAAVTILDDCFVGFDAILAGGISIGPKSYVCAGAIVTRDVPAFHIASGTNTIQHFSMWEGPLASNPLFHDEPV